MCWMKERSGSDIEYIYFILELYHPLIRPDLLNVMLLELDGAKIFRF